MKILFMGTPGIAVAALDALRKDNREIVAVVTAPDKPAGRGKQLQSSDVKTYSLEHGLKIMQPEKLKAPDFLAEISSLAPDLIVVVAFRILPEEVWAMPPMGTINLHASRLPQYRGAAPINWAIMNGETETGVSTFFIEKDIDTGKIIMQESVPILPDDNAGKLHDRITVAGAQLLVRTVSLIEDGNPPGTDQSELIKPEEVLKTAPKIFKEDCRINWNRSARDIYNQIRGLSPYPSAWTVLISPDGRERVLKIHAAELVERETVFSPRTLLTDGKSRFEIACKKGIINLKELQLEGKKKLGIEEFMRGMPDLSSCELG
jgi:methionyl-tRNA formyltransferase